MGRREVAGRREALCALGALALIASGCKGNPPPKLAKVKPGAMPKDGNWTGVYFSELIGEIHLLHNNGDVTGKWRRKTGERFADFRGTTDGNLLKFEWTEYVTGGVGPNTKKSGRGYLVFTRPEGPNTLDTLEGQIGRDKDEVGEPVKAVRQLHQSPNLDSIGGTDASDIGGGDWDVNKESGKPEPPAAP